MANARKIAKMTPNRKAPGKAGCGINQASAMNLPARRWPGRCRADRIRRRRRRTGCTPSRLAARHSPRRAGSNRRTWLYRIRPSVAHRPFEPIDQGLLRSAPFDEVPTPPNQLRWQPLPIPAKPTDFMDGLITMAGNGDAHTHAGVGIHIYAANASMTDRFFFNADGEMLIVPQLGRLSSTHGDGTARSRARRNRGDSARNSNSALSLLEKASARLYLRELRRLVSPAGPRADRRERPGESARFPELRWPPMRTADGDFRIVAKFQGRLVERRHRSLSAECRRLAWKLRAL